MLLGAHPQAEAAVQLAGGCGPATTARAVIALPPPATGSGRPVRRAGRRRRRRGGRRTGRRPA
ncbi:hypothetical protein [Streptomyces sp. NPDC001546]|uniref:hypothetical protein n=1 Tax=Streptomyces sp. NPDC001546 TaxID=3364585 RepID=UPI003693DF71